MFALGSVGHAGASVDDPTGCLDVGAVEAALRGVVGADRLDVAVSVLPEGQARAVRLVWGEVATRDLEVVAADCPRLPEMIALATERVLARLPTGLGPAPAPWTGAAGLGAGLGWPWSPRVEAWVQTSPDRGAAPVVGGAAAVGAQPLGSGSVWSVGLDLRVGAALVGDRVRAAVLGVVGARAGIGAGVVERQVGLLPRAAARLEVGSAGPWRLGGALDVPVLNPVWSVAGGGSAAEPWLVAQLVIGREWGGR